MSAPRIAVVGHVEHVTLGRVAGVIAPGDVVHLTDPRFIPGGGGGIAFAQLCASDAEVHFFTAVGSDAVEVTGEGRDVGKVTGPATGPLALTGTTRTKRKRLSIILMSAKVRE